ncbi:GNAT family N-acetyltransferase [Streptomyces lanatus]|uniref:GNAT family N-acetyltransferase n=1 Tax=Streptomyces lanatus TaxID=66900 RepID=A0ABV1Y2P6_9ACTN|nr:GNAT family N-acetyltransferase [Streptomyces lanatus]
MDATNVRVRPARAGDGRGIAVAWVDSGRYYAAIYPDHFQIPSGDVAATFEQMLATGARPEQCRLVAEVTGEVVGYIAATLHAAAGPPEGQFTATARRRVWVDALMVRASDHRRGVGSMLMEAVEDWAKRRDAATIELDTFARSPLSVPFYEHLGYQRHAIVFRKRLS